MNPTSRQLRFAYVVYATALIVLALVHTVGAQTRPTPYTDPDGFLADQANQPITGWTQHTSRVRPDCVGVYGNTIWMCPEAPSPTAQSTENLGSTEQRWIQVQDTATMPAPSSRTLMFGNVVTGRPGESQDYVPFLNLVNGPQPQGFIVTVVTAVGQWQNVYDMPAFRHRSINLQDCPLLAGKVTGFGVFVQAWGVATATVSLHRGTDPWGPAYQTIQPDAIPTPLSIIPER